MKAMNEMWLMTVPTTFTGPLPVCSKQDNCKK